MRVAPSESPVNSVKCKVDSCGSLVVEADGASWIVSSVPLLSSFGCEDGGVGIDENDTKNVLVEDKVSCVIGGVETLAPFLYP